MDTNSLQESSNSRYLLSINRFFQNQSLGQARVNKQIYLLNTLEKIYKKIIRFYIYKFNMHYIYNLPYHERLNKLNPPSFNAILTSSQLSFISKLTFNKFNSPHLLASLKFHTPQYHFRKSPSFYIPLNKHFKLSPLCQAIISCNKNNS